MSKFVDVENSNGEIQTVPVHYLEAFPDQFKPLAATTPAVDSTESSYPDSSWKVADLKAYAADHDLDLGEATKKEDIVAAIAAASDSVVEPTTEKES